MHTFPVIQTEKPGLVKTMKLMKNELMSSEDSDDNNTVNVKPLPWRLEYVDKIFHIDKYTSANK